MCYDFPTGLVLIYIGGLLLGIGFAWTTTTIVRYVVNVWSRENKGTIMGLILCFNGVGGAIAVNMLTPIIESNVNGYKTAYFIIAGIVLIIFLLMLFLFRDKPKNATEEQTQTQSKKVVEEIG